ncbi:MAG: hypothetical protein EU539_02880 [Promethearchaeota archaeon]|nr:MAG: hypothetical protein EU539_02880 [Candidatus Lokiarchaeota archaeon]
MTQKNVIILFGTNYGSTKEIAETIAEVLQKNNIATNVKNLEEAKKIPPIQNYNGIIIGTSMKINSWKKHVKKYLEKNQDDIKNSKIKFGMFTCGANAITNQEKAREEIKEKLNEYYDLKADLFEAFAGVLDLSENSNVGFLGKKALKLAAKEMLQTSEFQFDPEGRNDYRDWEGIKKFAQDFIEIL